MKNMLKNKTSLIIVCVFIGILICYFTMCNCRTNYSLMEGMTASAPKPAPAPSSSSTPLKGPIDMAADRGVDVSAKPSSTDTSSNTTSGAKKPNGLANGSKPSTTSTNAAPVDKANFQAGREGFQRQRPIDLSSIQESKSDEWNLSKWVKDAMRYAKGMGNENRLDSYQYNTGPPIPLPEGELFFFKDTKFSPDCCPGTYSSSLGCACLSKPQFNHLVTRGGNNTVPTGRKTSYYNEY
jgi:hypothetical protein